VRSLSIVANEQSHGPVLHLLEKDGWDKPKVASYCYRAAIDKVFESAPWVNKDRRYRYRQYIFPWSNLTDEERTQLEDEKGPGSWRDEITPSSPLIFPKTFEPNTSLGIRIQGEIAGWNITGMYEPDTLLYGSYFVRKHFRNAGMPIALLLESLKRQQASGIVNVIWFAAAENKMVKLYDRIFGPRISSRNAVYTVNKRL